MPHAFTAPDAPGPNARTTIARLRPFLKSLALIVLLPLALLGLGLWETNCGAVSLADLKQSQADLPQALTRLRAMAAQNPHAVLRFAGAKSAVIRSPAD